MIIYHNKRGAKNRLRLEIHHTILEPKFVFRSWVGDVWSWACRHLKQHSFSCVWFYFHLIWGESIRGMYIGCGNSECVKRECIWAGIVNVF